jgi:hypothetical protein
MGNTPIGEFPDRVRLSATPSLLVYRWRVRLQRKRERGAGNGESEVARKSPGSFLLKA